MTNPSHQLWLEAHYALGKLEVAQGFILDWRARSEFLSNYFKEHEHEFPMREDVQ